MEISREELYRRVWQTPITKLAKEFDISDVGLSKACRKNAIPTPPVGYWAKVAHGKTVKRPALPKVGIDKVVVLEAARYRASPPAEVATPAIPLPTVEVRREVVAVELATVAASTLSVLSHAKPDKDGFVRSGSSVAFSCGLSAKTIERAALLLDAIERALPEAGVTLIRDRETKRIALEAEGERLAFFLTEDYARTEHVTKDPRYGWPLKSFTYAFKGTLKLSLDANFQGRKTWSDGVRGRLEDKLASFVVGIVEAARSIRAAREAREEQQRAWEERSRLAQIEADLARRRKAFTDSFLAEAAAWARYQQARSYLDHLKCNVSATLTDMAPPSAAWLEQAHASIERLNPAAKRVQRLQDGYEPSDWLAPFGETVVPTYTGP